MSASHTYAGIAANSYVKTTDNMPIKSYEDCKAFLLRGGAHRFEDEIASNVRVLAETGEGDDVTYAVELYNTKIIRYWPDGTFTVSNGGFNTMTTATRINQFTPDWFRCFHHKKKLRGWNIEEDRELTHDIHMPVNKED